MFCIPSTSTYHSPPIRPFRFWLELKCWPIPLWFYSNTVYATGAVMDWECWQDVPIPTTRLYQLWTTTVCFLPPQWITLHPYQTPHRIWLELKCLPIPEWFYINPGYDTSAVMEIECWQGVYIPITRLYQPQATMFCIPSTSTDHSPPIRPLRFWLDLNAGQFLSGSIAAQVMPHVLWWTGSVGWVFPYL